MGSVPPRIAVTLHATLRTGFLLASRQRIRDGIDLLLLYLKERMLGYRKQTLKTLSLVPMWLAACRY